MNERQYRNRIPDILRKTQALMRERKVPIRASWLQAEKEKPFPAIIFVDGAEVRFTMSENDSGHLKVGRDHVEESRFDPVVHAMAYFLQDRTTVKGNGQDKQEPGTTEPLHDRPTLAASYIQTVYLFKYNRNTVKGLFFYCKMNNIKNGDKYFQAQELASGIFDVEKAIALNEICKGIIT